jgi:hypothetical protein
MAEKMFVSSDIKVPLTFKGKLLNFNNNEIHKSGEKCFIEKKLSISLIYLACVLFSTLYIGIQSKKS